MTQKRAGMLGRIALAGAAAAGALLGGATDAEAQRWDRGYVGTGAYSYGNFGFGYNSGYGYGYGNRYIGPGVVPQPLVMPMPVQPSANRHAVEDAKKIGRLKATNEYLKREINDVEAEGREDLAHAIQVIKLRYELEDTKNELGAMRGMAADAKKELEGYDNPARVSLNRNGMYLAVKEHLEALKAAGKIEEFIEFDFDEHGPDFYVTRKLWKDGQYADIGVYFNVDGGSDMGYRTVNFLLGDTTEDVYRRIDNALRLNR